MHQRNSTKLTVILLLAVGLALIGGGAMFGLLATSLFENSADRIEKLTSSSVAMLRDGQPGRKVLVEGHISSDNPTPHHSYVAYVREELETDSDGDTEWIEHGRMTPPLLLEIAGGSVQIENDIYDLEHVKTLEFHHNIRYHVIETNDIVIAVGILVSDAIPPQIDAEFIALGTQAEYIASQRKSGNISRVIGIAMASVGSVLALVALAIGLLSKRR